MALGDNKENRRHALREPSLKDCFDCKKCVVKYLCNNKLKAIYRKRKNYGHINLKGRNIPDNTPIA